MAKNSWVVERGGKNYYVVYEPNRISGGSYSVNGFTRPITQRGLSVLGGIDIAFELGDADAHLVVHGARGYLAVDGAYVDSGQPYIPNSKIPWFTYAFAVACLLIPLLTFGGIVPILIGFGGIAGCVLVSVSPESSALKKLLLCALIALAAWALLLGVGAALGAAMAV